LTVQENSEEYLSYGDFIAPKSSGVKDYIGLFAISTGFGGEKVEQQLAAQHDDYSIIMLKALADRLV
jgi:5-methyltetrahydrofolate--homocysteine methyltransferase